MQDSKTFPCALKYFAIILAFTFPPSLLAQSEATLKPVDVNDYTEFVDWIRISADEKEIPGAALAIVSR